MSIVAAGHAGARSSRSRREDGEKFTRDDLRGQTTVLVFYPFAFSPVCTDQFQIYEELLEELAARGATLYGVSCDAAWSQTAFREKLGVTIEQLSDFEPKGAACARLRRLLRAGRLSQPRARHRRPRRGRPLELPGRQPGDLPGANLIFDGLAVVTRTSHTASRGCRTVAS